jgi:hypothetical protein
MTARAAELASERLRRLGVSGALVAHVWMPLFFGVVFGWLRVSRTHDWEFLPALTYWILAVQLCWLVQGGATWVVQRMLAPWRPRLLWLLLMGSAVGTPLVDVVMRMLVESYHLWVIPPELHEPLPPMSLETLVSGHVIGVFIWVVSNLAIVHVLGFARFGFAAGPAPVVAAKEVAATAGAAASAAGAGDVMPAFVARLNRPVGRLVMLKAEQHYLRVVGELGEDLIHYRISDAVGELEGMVPGLRVHRSFWVARHAVSHSERGARGLALRLRTGELVPVSRNCREMVQAAGIAQGRPSQRPVVELDGPDVAAAAFGASEAAVRAKPVAGRSG